ncbi:MAG: hypothetical protein H3C48_03925 [Chitinophagaceae bacterium]|nr:hypothetical protein [Chitinophagaceae bacterium]
MKMSHRQFLFGSLQPLLFLIGMYFVVLVFSVFICSTIYKSINGNGKSVTKEAKAVSVASTGSSVTHSIN